MASLTVTYVLWLFFGWLGLHHVYLGRCDQAFVWFATLGGGFGVGWLRDLWRIPHYVKWSTGDPAYQKKLLMRIAGNLTPSCSLFRLAGIIVMGYVCAAALCFIVPEYLPEEMTASPVFGTLCLWSGKLLYVIGAILGTYIVANIGELQCSIKQPFYGCLFLFFSVFSEDGRVSMAPVLAGLSIWFRGFRWRQLEPESVNRVGAKKRHCVNFSMYCLVSGVWLLILCFGLYFNANVSIDGGEKIPLRVAISNFFKSDAWIRTKDSLYQMYRIYRHAGWTRMFNDAKQLFDLSGEGHAYRILDLDSKASQEEINKRCRSLSRDNHPDRFKDPTEKENAQEKFIEIQAACSTLSATRTRRAKSSSQSEDKKTDSNPFGQKDEF
ncbi:unnamed protein product [Lymnaea stagnalis]|uniref:DnaJ homolog subfamily C member 22 n=1 Tax=Lymnaea stagnalis TaxID=6523 RepID=A0AAV2HNW8_LYMST